MDEELLSRKRVLVIEDEMLVVMAIEDILADLGCTSITVAGNVETALHCVEADMFDLATLDVNLHGTRSYAVADALEESHIPFAFATGYGEHGVDEGYGDHPVLNKPFTQLQFERVVGGLLADGVPPALAA
jgi:CheY-like chemotaxis protein